MAHDVFISHSSKDKPTADAVCHALEAAGIRCWIAPRDIQPSEEWGEAIVHGIAGAKVFVLVFSANANASHQITREVERAVHHAIPIIPFRIENVQPTDSLEYFISTPHWLDAIAPPMEQHLAYLVSVVQHLMLGTDAPPRPTPKPPAPPFWRRLSVTAIGLLAALALAGGWAAWAMLRPGEVSGHWISSKLELDGGAMKAAFWTLPLNELIVPALTGPKASLDFQDNEAGLYRAKYVGEDQGQVTADGRGLTFTSALSGKVSRVSYNTIGAGQAQGLSTLGAQPGDGALILEAPGLWQFMWVGRADQSAAPASGVPAEIIGAWRNSFVSTPAGQIWSGEMTIDAAGHYILRLTRSESGQFEAAKGHWKRTPTISGVGVPGMPDQGAYKFHGRDLVTYTSPLGSVTYRRVGPYEDPKA